MSSSSLTRRKLLASGTVTAAALFLPKWALAKPPHCNPHFCPTPKPKFVSITAVVETSLAAATV